MDTEREKPMTVTAALSTLSNEQLEKLWLSRNLVDGGEALEMALLLEMFGRSDFFPADEDLSDRLLSL
jgi:hypothetical protein